MRDTAAFNRLLQLEGVKVTEVDFGDDTVTVTVRLQRRKLACPACGFTTWARYDTRPVASSWRHLRLGTWRLVVRAQLRRLDDHFDIGLDEVSWKKHQNYLTLVVDHDTNKVVWGAEGRDAKTLDGFFDELGEARSGQIRAVSMDMGPAFRKSVTADGHAPQATICFDPFHVVQVGTDALNTVRRDLWQQIRRLPDPDFAKKFKGARWALLKNPEDLTDRQVQTLAAIRRNGGALWRAYQRKEELRAIFAADDLTDNEVADMLDRWCARVQRSRLDPFVKAGCTIRKHRDGILAAIGLGLTNARLEGLNQRVRLIVRRALGFHSAHAALALVMLSCGPVTITLPWQSRT